MLKGFKHNVCILKPVGHNTYRFCLFVCILSVSFKCNYYFVGYVVVAIVSVLFRLVHPLLLYTLGTLVLSTIGPPTNQLMYTLLLFAHISLHRLFWIIFCL